MYHRLRGRLFVLVLAALLFSGCATSNPYRRIDNEAHGGNYERGITLINENQKSLYRQRDAVLYYLDKGMLTHYAAQYDDSIVLLQDGERAIEAAFTKSITMEVGTYILNDNTQEYDGEDYEDVYINVFNALNYYHKDDLEGALVEIRRMNNKLRFLASKYGVLISNMQKKALEESAEVPNNEELAGTKFNDSAFARYLGILFYRGLGQYDDARIDRDFLKVAFANTPAVYSYPVPSSIDQELEIPRGKARLNLLAFSGMGPVKEEEVIRIPLPGPRWAKIALPVLNNRPSQVSRIGVVIDGKETFDLELLEDMGAVARETFKEKVSLIYLKTILRATIKGLTSSALGIASDETSGEASLILGLLSIGTQVMAEASEKADLRISRYFPAKAYVGGINLNPGVYSVTVNYYAQNGRIIASYAQDGVMVKENVLNLMEAVCLR
jgi:hypothetical protein